MNHETLRQWIKTAEHAERPEAVAGSTKDAEIAALRKQVRELEMERDGVITRCVYTPSTRASSAGSSRAACPPGTVVECVPAQLHTLPAAALDGAVDPRPRPQPRRVSFKPARSTCLMTL